MSEFRLHDRQRAWVNDRSRFKAGMASRQTGKTAGTTLEIVEEAIERELGGGKSRWVILSRGERQAREAIAEGVQFHLSRFKAAFKQLEIQWEGCEDKALEVILPGGSRITGVPANPDTARGFTANVLLDEFGFHADSRKIWGALFPVISRPDLLLRVISTPNGKSNKFFEIMTLGGMEALLRESGHVMAGQWSLHFWNIYDAVRGGLDRNPEELREALNDQDMWDQEFLLLWLDEASAWLDYELINAVEHDKAGDPSQYGGGVCYVGVDIGRRKDLFVIWVVERVGDVFWTREIIAKRRISFAQQDDLLDGVMKRYRVGRVCMDQTGMGEKPVEDAQRRYGSSMVEGILFTGAHKQVLATNGKQVFEDRKIRIPLGDSELRSDLHALKKLTTPTGNVRFDSDGDTDGHSDRAWAGFLALYAGSTPYQPYDYQPARYAHDPRRPNTAPMHADDDDDDDDGRDIKSTAGFGARRGAW